MWFLFALFAVVAGSLVSELSPSSSEPDSDTDEEITNDESLNNLIDVEVNLSETEETQEIEVQNTLSENEELETDNLTTVESFIIENVEGFRDDADIIIWHYDPNEITHFQIDRIQLSDQVVYPEIQEVRYEDTVIAHVERDAYGV